MMSLEHDNFILPFLKMPEPKSSPTKLVLAATEEPPPLAMPPNEAADLIEYIARLCWEQHRVPLAVVIQVVYARWVGRGIAHAWRKLSWPVKRLKRWRDRRALDARLNALAKRCKEQEADRAKS
jgi:hypothetical protein